jgi:hypothetical protein
VQAKIEVTVACHQSPQWKVFAYVFGYRQDEVFLNLEHDQATILGISLPTIG